MKVGYTDQGATNVKYLKYLSIGFTTIPNALSVYKLFPPETNKSPFTHIINYLSKHSYENVIVTILLRGTNTHRDSIRQAAVMYS